MKNKKPAFVSMTQKITAPFAWRVAAMAMLICAAGLFGAAARAQGTLPARAQVTPSTRAQSKSAPPSTVFVKTQGGGFILGYDIDQNGTEGVLAESLSLAGGTDNAAIETFDQTTGKILKVVAKQNNTKNDYVCLGIYGTSVGLVELEKVKGLFVNQRVYSTMNPLSLNKLTGPWTPGLATQQLLIGIADSQGAAGTAVLAEAAANSFNSEVFSADIAANTFGPAITLTDQNFGFNVSPHIAINTVTNQALVTGGSGAFDTHPLLAQVDLASQSVTELAGLGFGFINGVAVDSADGIAVTATEDDFSIEYYQLSPFKGIKTVVLKNATDQSQSGQYVKFDPVNRLFLIGQEFSSTAPTGSSILVYDTRGNFVEAINGLSLPASPVNIAINPSKRMGFVLVTPALTQLQSFTY
jgi:hypothetical protein